MIPFFPPAGRCRSAPRLADARKPVVKTTCDMWPSARSATRDRTVAAHAVFRARQTGEGGPVPPTGKKVEADCVYVMDFDGDRIRHLTKFWNDGISLKQLGWMQGQARIAPTSSERTRHVA